MFPDRLFSKACQHILDIVGLSQTEVCRTYLIQFNSHCCSFIKTNLRKINYKGLSKHQRFCWQQLLGLLHNIAVSLKSIRPDIKFIAEEKIGKLLHMGSKLQLTPPFDYCSNA